MSDLPRHRDISPGVIKDIRNRMACLPGELDLTAYHVIAKQWEHGWELHIDGIGVTQSRLWSDAAAMVRDYLAADDIFAAETAEVIIVPSWAN